MKKLLSSLIFLSIFSLCFAQNKLNDKSNLAYRSAKAYYDTQEYGKCLEYAENAMTYRKQQVESEIQILTRSLSTRQLKSAGDNINKVIDTLKERDEQNCVDIINSYIKKYGINKFNNSIEKLLKFIKEQESFPEAQILIGDVYKIEGEYDLAEQYYFDALKNSEVMDIPDQKYSVLYTLADISSLKNDKEQMEKRLLNITAIADPGRNKLIMKNMIQTIGRNTTEYMNKFFVMYRSYDYYSLEAYCRLADYYLSIEQYEKALGYCALAVITGYSKAYSIIEKRNLAFEYKDIQKFLEEVQNYDDIVFWGSENKVWESFNLLSEISFKIGYDVFARNLLVILSKASPEKYWQQSAVLKLDSLDGIK
ncbi:MAG: hypothetical protein K6E97_11840 [Treponema sp.]|nr:hypothetical protein [Treponema sp.]